MNMFFRRGINEYQRQINLKDSFVIQTGRLRDIIESINRAGFDEPFENRCRPSLPPSLLLLSPLVEIAWADGRVSRRESDLILQVAESYGLTKTDADYCELLQRLISRPVSQAVGRMWQDLREVFERLPAPDRQIVSYCLTVQAQFVAEQSSDNLIAFLRGERVNESERETLALIQKQLKNAEEAAALLDVRLSRERAAKKAAEAAEKEIAAPVSPVSAPPSIAGFGNASADSELEDYGKLIPLVPLVKTAWAEGRVTKRERHMIFEAASRMGVKPGTSAHRRLAEWLELHPTADFYDAALETLNEHWQTLDADEKSRRKIDLLSDCTRIAEASGGAKNYPSGGAKICDEEIAAVKLIANKLNVAG